jgi:LytS/YehU family sensor histidine kinase
MYMLGVGSVAWYAIAIAFPLLLVGARRTATDKFNVARIVALSIAAFAAGVALTLVADYLITYPGGFRPPFSGYLAEGLRRNTLPWIALIAVVAAIESRRRAVASRVERERLRAQIAEQRLVALTGQLQPHFLFNTLQGISTLIHRDPRAADEMLGKLSDLLRETLRHRDQALVPLGDEIRYARTYLEIAQLRFADRLRFSIVVSPGLGNAAVPLFILQPLVENSIGHGIGGQALGGTISVRASRDGNRLTLEVEDDGIGLPSNGKPAEGVGLTNTRERLRASFADDAALTLRSADAGGTLARIDMPFRTLPAGS